MYFLASRTFRFAENAVGRNFRFAQVAVVGLGGLEPPTSRLSGVRSNLLSYKPI